MAAKNQFGQAYQLCADNLDLNNLRESQATQVRQIAKTCRLWGRAEKALPWLRQWLEKYPDAPDSGSIWLALSFTATKCGPDHRECAMEALSQAKKILGAGPVIDKVQSALNAP